LIGVVAFLLSACRNEALSEKEIKNLYQQEILSNDILKTKLKLEFKELDNGWKLVKAYNNKS